MTARVAPRAVWRWLAEALNATPRPTGTVRAEPGMVVVALPGGAELTFPVDLAERWVDVLGRKAAEARQLAAALPEQAFDLALQLEQPHPGTALRRYRVRTCRTLHECAVCQCAITAGQAYHDGGHGRRAHVGCVPEAEVSGG